MVPQNIEEEEIVFNTIQDYLNENKILDREKVINRIKSNFSKVSININQEGIIKHIDSLIKKKRIVEGSKLTKDGVLLNTNRKKIYDFIKTNPGTYFYKITNELNMGNQLVFWHLNFLIEFELIKKAIIENHEIYFISSLSVEEGKRLYYTIKEESKKILDYLKADDSGATKKKLSLELDLAPKTVTKYIESLEKFNFLDKKKISEKETLYFSKET